MSRLRNRERIGRGAQKEWSLHGRRQISLKSELFWDQREKEYYYPTSPFTILKLQNPWLDVPELHKIRRSPDLDALKLWKGSSGMYFVWISIDLL